MFAIWNLVFGVGVWQLAVEEREPNFVVFGTGVVGWYLLILKVGECIAECSCVNGQQVAGLLPYRESVPQQQFRSPNKERLARF
jgi:hypothetical protein